MTDDERWWTRVVQRRRELGGEGKVLVGKAYELHWTLGQLLVIEEEAEEVPTKLSMTAWWWWWWMAVRKGDNPTIEKGEEAVRPMRDH
jgi:hypothetical protein